MIPNINVESLKNIAVKNHDIKWYHMDSMRIIENEFNRVRNLSLKVGKDFLKSNKYKDDREIYILGGFATLLKLGGIDCPKYFEKFKPPEPDFKTFNMNQEFFKDIEIASNILWGRKIGKEEKNYFMM